MIRQIDCNPTIYKRIVQSIPSYQAQLTSDSCWPLAILVQQSQCDYMHTLYQALEKENETLREDNETIKHKHLSANQLLNRSRGKEREWYRGLNKVILFV